MDNGASSYRRFLDGDDEGIVEIVRDYKDGLQFFLNRYVQDPNMAEELTEETFFRLVTRRPQFKEDHAFKTWLYTIGRNLALNAIKEQQKRAYTPVEEMNDLAASGDCVESAYLREEQNLQLNRALGRLRQQYATALHLKYFETMTNEQIAKVLKKSRRQVENLIYQAKLALKTELLKEGFVYEKL